MRQYIYKTIIAVVALIIVFEFTIGKTINKFNQKAEIIFTKEGRKGMVSSVKNEMQKAIDLMAAEYYMPDVQRIGGVTGWLEASSLGYVNDIDLSSHLFPEISCHLLSATANCHWLEYVDWASPIMENPK